ncbi:hypothetical protein Asal01_00513 [Fodinibius salicampi]
MRVVGHRITGFGLKKFNVKSCRFKVVHSGCWIPDGSLRLADNRLKMVDIGGLSWYRLTDYGSIKPPDGPDQGCPSDELRQPPNHEMPNM